MSAERFFRAAEQGDLPAIRALVATRPELVRLDRAENDEHTALHFAVLNRDLACTAQDPDRGVDTRIRRARTAVWAIIAWCMTN